jgi:hypothetical protein
MSEPSQSEANKMVRVLNGTGPLKFTVRVHLPDGKNVIEFQHDEGAKIEWNNEARALWLQGGEYSSRPIMAWPEGAILIQEENPK